MKTIGVLLINEPYGGGAFQYNQSILDALAILPKREFQITAFYLCDVWKEYLKKYDFAVQKVIDTKTGNFFGKATRKICRIMGIPYNQMMWLLNKIDVFIKPLKSVDLMIFPSQEDYAELIDTNAISVIHDLMHRYENFPEVRADGEYDSREKQFKAICRNSKLIFVDSEIGQQQVVECYGKEYAEKLCVLPFTPPQYLFEEYDDDSKLADLLPKKFIFYPAQFWEHKNHKRLIVAVKLLKDIGVNIELVLVGSKKNGYNEAIKCIDKMGLKDRIHILGYVSDVDMCWLYKHARAMIMPSCFGPTNIPPLEGMATGCPVAVADVYAMPWQVGDAGLTFNPLSVEEIADTLKKLWLDDELCHSMIEKGYKQIENFTQDKFNERFEKYIRKAFSD